MPGLEYTIGFIGLGNMGWAIMAGLLAAGNCAPEKLLFFDASEERRREINERCGIAALTSNAAVVEASDVVIFAVKPQMMKTVLEELTRARVFVTAINRKSIVSIAAGIRIATIERYVYKDLDKHQQSLMPILRAMPNTPALIGAGMTGLCANRHATARDMGVVRDLLSAVGGIIECTESEMDGVTAVSGSGPAYVFYLAEAMMEAAASLGFTPDVAANLTITTLKGAAALLENQNETPEALRRNVTSPGGTTEAAVQVLNDNGVKQTIVAAVMAAARRSAELSG
jgi:pyrroline-5-carboxylate reductase